MVDARDPAAYKKGHIEGAVLFNVMAELRYPPDATPRAMTMKSAGGAGGALRQPRDRPRAARVVVYDAAASRRPSWPSPSSGSGNENVAVLDGGVDAWAKEARLPLVAGDPRRRGRARPSPPRPKHGSSMNNRQTAPRRWQEPGTVVLDVRSVAPVRRACAGTRLVQNAGHLEKTVNLSVRGLWTPEGFLQGPEGDRLAARVAGGHQGQEGHRHLQHRAAGRRRRLVRAEVPRLPERRAPRRLLGLLGALADDEEVALTAPAAGQRAGRPAPPAGGGAAWKRRSQDP